MYWWDKKYGKDKICGITRIRLRCGKNKVGKSVTVYLKCGHGFYRSAIKNWVYAQKGNSTCPLCRKEFDSIDAFI